MAEIEKKLGIHPEKQKIIFKGHTLNTPQTTLSEYGIKNGARLLLVASSESVKKDNQQRSAKTNSKSKAAKHDHSKKVLKQAIIDKGPPEGCIEGNRTQVGVFPKEPFIVYDTNGIVARMSIESDAIWIEAENDQKERIFTSDEPTHPEILDIPGYEDQYFALKMITEHGQRVFYFLPKQYYEMFKQLLRPT